MNNKIPFMWRYAYLIFLAIMTGCWFVPWPYKIAPIFLFTWFTAFWLASIIKKPKFKSH